MKDCKHYDNCDDMMESIKRIDRENTLQEASLKSMHKRLDSMGSYIEQLAHTTTIQAETIKHQAQTLDTHMEWEERYHGSIKRAIVVIGTLAVSFVSWVTLQQLNSTEQMAKISTSLESFSDSTREFIKEQKELNDKLRDLFYGAEK